MKALLTQSNNKTLKGEKYGYLTMVLFLAPAKLSGYNLCPKSTHGCEVSCLNTAGRGKMPMAQTARIRRAKQFVEDRPAFMAQLVSEIEKAKVKAMKQGLKLLVRLNCTSDILFERISIVDNDGYFYDNIFSRFPDVQFYDYTAIPRYRIPDNLHLTFSRKENNDKDVQLALRQGLNVAVVFANKNDYPSHFYGMPVINGDEHDIRITDPKGVVVALYAKGKAIKDTSGFVIR